MNITLLVNDETILRIEKYRAPLCQRQRNKLACWSIKVHYFNLLLTEGTNLPLELIFPLLNAHTKHVRQVKCNRVRSIPWISLFSCGWPLKTLQLYTVFLPLWWSKHYMLFSKHLSGQSFLLLILLSFGVSLPLSPELDLHCMHSHVWAQSCSLVQTAVYLQYLYYANNFFEHNTTVLNLCLTQDVHLIHFN